MSEDKLPSIKQPNYVIGVDTYDEKALAYCFGRYKTDGTFEVLLQKHSNNKKSFNEEVENLAKYFNATIFKEVE